MTELLWKVHDSLEEIEQLESLRVFISGTYDDLREYRQIIADTLLQLRHEPCEPFKQTSSHDTLCAFARYQILEYTHAYLGFFGLRYGTRIDTQEDAVSISEYEYDLACEHLGKLQPAPLFVLLPEPGSELYETLKARAANELKSNDAEYIARDARSQEQFIDKIRRKKALGEGNRIVQPLHRESDIAARTVTCITSYTGRALRSRAGGAKSAVRQALRAPVAGPPANPSPLPARLKPHLSQASALFYEFFNASKARLLPGLCVLIHGAPGRGQKILAEKIVESAIPWEVEAPCFHELSASSPDVDRDVWEVLWNATGVQPEQRARTDVEELAKHIVTAERPLVAVLGKMHLVDGGPTRFISTIWQPLHDAMARLLSPHGSQRQFLTVILSYELAAARERDPKFNVSWKPNGQPDYRYPMVLDAL